MRDEIDGLINKLRKMKVIDNRDDYSYLVSLADRCDDKSKIFDLLRNNTESPQVVVPLLFTFTSKLDPTVDEVLLTKIIDFVRGYKKAMSETSEWITKILFVILEKVKDRRRDSEVMLKLLECIKVHGESKSIVNHLVSFMQTKNNGDIVMPVLDFLPSISDEFIRCSMKQDNPVLLKNLATVLTQLSTKQTHLFVNYQHFCEFLDSEHFFMRNCFLEICMNIAPYFKDKGEIEKLNDVVNMVVERLLDGYFLVRYKALQVLQTFFEKECIVLSKRAEIICEISGRVLDKTVMVRKKAVSICSGLLMNHPFLSEKTLRKKEVNNDEKRKYYEDMNQFHDVMKETQDNIVSLLNGGTKTETNECVEFIKLSFHYEIDGSKEAFESLFDLVWSQDADVLLSSFKDLFIHMRSCSSSLFSFLARFVRTEGNDSFERVLRELSRRGYLDTTFANELCDKFFQGISLFESSYFLLHTGRALPIDMFYRLLLCSTQVLFGVRNDKELIYALQIYKNVIRVKTRGKAEPGDGIIDLLVKNLVKMTFFDQQIVDFTTAAIYSVSARPEDDGTKLLERLCFRNENSLKLVSAVGCIGLRHLQYLEEVEKLLKNKKAVFKLDSSVITPEIRERRRSINASRQSLSKMTNGNEDSMEQCSQDEELISGFKDRSEEEIADFFFYIREKEMLYGNTILSVFKELVEGMCNSTHEDVQVVSYASLYKLMCISSEFFVRHYETFIQSLQHVEHRIRANAVIAMNDFLLIYNTLVEEKVHLLFDVLRDPNANVKRNGLLVIQNLLLKNVLKIKGHGVSLIYLLMDEDTEIKEMTKKLLRRVSERESIIATIFYEVITTNDIELVPVIDFLTDLVGEKTREGLFIKALRSSIDLDVLEHLHQTFDLSEKFLGEISHIKEFKNMRMNKLHLEIET